MNRAIFGSRKPMLTICYIEPQEPNYKYLLPRNAFEDVACIMAGHFVQASLSVWRGWVQRYLSGRASVPSMIFTYNPADTSRIIRKYHCRPWWRLQMETFSALLALCAGNSPVTGEFLSKRRVTRRFDVSFDLRLDKRLSKRSRSWWFETPLR